MARTVATLRREHMQLYAVMKPPSQDNDCFDSDSDNNNYILGVKLYWHLQTMKAPVSLFSHTGRERRGGGGTFADNYTVIYLSKPKNKFSYHYP